MELRKCSIAGYVYGYLPANTVAEDWDSLENDTIKYLQAILPYRYVPPSNFKFVDPLLFDHIRDDCEQRTHIVYFFLTLIVCHTVLIDRDERERYLDDNAENAQLGHVPNDEALLRDSAGKDNLKQELLPHLFHFKAQSPDEAALVAAARDLGFVFLGRDHNMIFVSVLGEFEAITVLHVLEFDSERKRMSVIVQRRNGELLLMCKGADNIIFERLSMPSKESEIARMTQQQLENFAEEGLRTLCLGYRILDHNLYREWSERFVLALAETVSRDLLTAALSDEIETDLTLLGATAIEDRLQDGVPECIELLQRAGIKIWVLTGDKMETAINIGFSCKLLHKRMVLLVVKGQDAEGTFTQLRNAYEKIWGRYFSCYSTDHLMPAEGIDDQFALIIEGGALKHAVEGKNRKLFVKLSSKCTSVICCRVSPLQKATVVELIKKSKNVMTMAIGDGANDVSMIQAADVGVGIAGQEGMQAVMSSDYAVAQFRFLERLLLVHGRWAYIRTAETILCSLYKNVAFVVLLFWYQFYCGFTAQYVYDYMYMLFFNLCFSILPLLLLGFLERDLPAERLLAVPQIYSLGIKQTSYSMKLFVLYLIDGLYQSVVCFFVPMLTYQDTALSWTGYPETQTLLGNVMAFSIIITVNLYMALNTLSWVHVSFGGIIITILAVISFAFVYMAIPSESLFGSFRDMIDPIFWASLILSIVLALSPRYIFKYVQAVFRPAPLDIVREVEKYHFGEEELMRISGRQDSGDIIDELNADPSASVGICAPPKALYRDINLRRPFGLEPPIIIEEDQEILLPFPDPKDHKVFPITNKDNDLTRPEQLSNSNNFLQRSLALFNLRTNRFERLCGFAFSQEDGMGEILRPDRRQSATTNYDQFGPTMNKNGTSGNNSLNNILAPPKAAATSSGTIRRLPPIQSCAGVSSSSRRSSRCHSPHIHHIIPDMSKKDPNV